MCAIDSILTTLEEISSRCESSDPDYIGRYNFFEVLGIEYNEVIVCRFIENLLNPKGSHGLAAEPLKQFIYNVLEDEISEENLGKATVVSEKHTDDNRRIDIVIYMSGKIYPIEVKIWADDQDNQLEDYYRYCFGESEKNKIYYLTPYGRNPSDKSKGKLHDNQISCISFSKDIKKWLGKINATGNVKAAIDNFMEVIDKMNEQSNNFDRISDALKLDNDDFDFKAKEIEGAIALLEYSDKIWKKIRANYLQKVLKIGKDYKLEICDTKDENVPHALMRIKKDNEIKAWICVETNLYIVINKTGDLKQGWGKYKEDYQWQYINHPVNHQHISLGSPTKLYDIEITLDEWLHNAE